jgi:uncharacterized membrane protein
MIGKVKVTVDGSRDGDVRSGDRISKKAAPGSEIEVGAEIGNHEEDTGGFDLLDVVAEMDIVGISGLDDAEQESRAFDLKAGSSEKVRFDKVTLPLGVQEGRYDIIIRAHGTDENGYEHEVEFNAALQVDRDRHDLRILQASSEPVLCGSQGSVRARIANFGTDSEDDVQVHVQSKDLGVDSYSTPFRLSDDADRSSGRKDIGIPYTIPFGALAGSHRLEVSVLHGDSVSDSTSVSADVSCPDTKSKTDKPLAQGLSIPFESKEGSGAGLTQDTAPIPSLAATSEIRSAGVIVISEERKAKNKTLINLSTFLVLSLIGGIGGYAVWLLKEPY